MEILVQKIALKLQEIKVTNSFQCNMVNNALEVIL